LIVDDSPTVRTIVRLLLSERPLEFLEAADGDAALKMAKHQPISLVIADFNMPRMDGLTFIRHLRAATDPYLRTLPVILLTANRDTDLAVRALREGASAFARKPISQDQLTAAIDRFLSVEGGP
jgi:two-component system chemotaxis response regulator CheY